MALIVSAALFAVFGLNIVILAPILKPLADNIGMNESRF